MPSKSLAIKSSVINIENVTVQFNAHRYCVYGISFEYILGAVRPNIAKNTVKTSRFPSIFVAI